MRRLPVLIKVKDQGQSCFVFPPRTASHVSGQRCKLPSDRRKMKLYGRTAELTVCIMCI